MNNKYSKHVVGYFGLLTPLVTLSLIFLAIYVSPSFLIMKDALSDLGVQKGLPGLLFNSALIFSGILLVPVAINIPKVLKHGKPLGAMLFVLSVDLPLISIFRVGNPLHLYLAIILFSIIPIMILYLVYIALKKEKYNPSKLELLMGSSAVAIWLYPWEGYAIPEIFAAFIISGWVMNKSLELLKS